MKSTQELQSVRVMTFALVAFALWLAQVRLLVAQSPELQQSPEEAQLSLMLDPQQKEDVPVAKPPTPPPPPNETASKLTVYGHVMPDSGYDVLQADPLW